MNVKEVYEGLKEYQALQELRQDLTDQQTAVKGGGHDDVPEAMREELAEMYNRQIALVTEKQAEMVFASVREVMRAINPVVVAVPESEHVDLPRTEGRRVTPETAQQLTPAAVFKDVVKPPVPPIPPTALNPLTPPNRVLPPATVPLDTSAHLTEEVGEVEDAAGELWDPIKHSTPAIKTTKGLWKKRRGYKTELKSVGDPETNAALMPPAVPGEITYDTLVSAVSVRFGSGVISVEGFGKLCAGLGFEYLSSIEGNPPLIQTTYDTLLREYPNETKSV